jgi:hypothetical protein
MLRGRCSCAISNRPTASSTLRLLATRHSSLATAFVSPLFPLHPGNSPVTPLFPLHPQKQGRGRLKSSANCGQSIVNCERAFLRSAFTTTSIEIVEPPTFLILDAIRKAQNPPASEGDLYKNFQPSTFNFEPSFSPNSNHSRTSRPFARKSNYSRTYARQGVGVPSRKMCSPITPLFSFTMLTI